MIYLCIDLTFRDKSNLPFFNSLEYRSKNFFPLGIDSAIGTQSHNLCSRGLMSSSNVEILAYKSSRKRPLFTIFFKSLCVAHTNLQLICSSLLLPTLRIVLSCNTLKSLA